jgi:hypothetical protein
MQVFLKRFRVEKLSDFARLNEADLIDEHLKPAERKRLAAVLVSHGLVVRQAGEGGLQEKEKGKEKPPAPLSSPRLEPSDSKSRRNGGGNRNQEGDGGVARGVGGEGGLKKKMQSKANRPPTGKKEKKIEAATSPLEKRLQVQLVEREGGGGGSPRISGGCVTYADVCWRVLTCADVS